MMMMNVVLLALCFSVIMKVTLALALRNVVLHVDSIKGNNNVTCLSGHGNIPCQHLEYISEELAQNRESSCSNLTILIDSSTLEVSNTVKFESCNGIRIASTGRHATANISCVAVPNGCITASIPLPFENTMHAFGSQQIQHGSDKYCVPHYPSPNCTGSSVGLIFENVRSLSFSNVRIKECGAYDHYWEHNAVNLSAAIHVRNSFNVSLQNVTFEKSVGTALALFNTFGNVSVQNVIFLNNTHSVHNSFVGGVLVKFSMPQAQALTFYSFKHCFFYKNSAPCYNEHRPNLTPKLSDWDTYGLGGAMSVLFANGSRNISVSINNCTFEENSAPWGAGLYMHLEDEHVDMNTVTVTDSEFRNNFAYIAGGGTMIGYSKRSSSKQMNKVMFKNTTFLSNRARYGGGTSLFAFFSDYKSFPYDSVIFDNCTWKNNYAFYSPAVDVSPHRLDQLNTGFLPIPVFKDCVYEQNHLKYRNNKNGTGYVTSGVFVISRFRVTFLGNNMFIGNNFTALLLNSATGDFKHGSIVLFENNTGILGAAIAMYGFSVLLLNDSVQFTFRGNSAIDCGGGIYYHSNEQRDFLEGLSCFLQYTGSRKHPNITFTFENNTATNGGSSIYSVSFYSCFYHYLGSVSNHDSLYFFNRIGNFTFDEDHKPLATVGMRFSFNDSSMPIKAYPGHQVFVNLTLIDELNSTVATDLCVNLTKRVSTDILLREHFASNNSITVYGPPGANGTVVLSTLGSIREVFYSVNVSLLQCPPGYFLNNKLGCQCSADNTTQTYRGIIKCNDATLQAYLRHSFWAGYHNPIKGNDSSVIGDPKHLYTAYCPLEFCRLNYVNYKFHLLPNNSKDLNQVVCMKHRQGVVCGECVPGYSVYYHSRHYKCGGEERCHLGALFYVLSELFPMFILFAIITSFNVSFMSGSVTGLILFCQLIDKLTIDYRHFQDDRKAKFGPLKTLRDIYQVVYGIFNFEFFSIDRLSFCLWKEASVMDILVFKYFTTFTAFVLVIALVGIMNTKYCLRICNGKKERRYGTKVTVKKSIIHGLSAFLIICYAQCTNVTFRILIRVLLWGNSNAQPSTLVVTYYGGMSYFEGDHLKYAIPALAVLLTIVTIPPIVLILNPLLLNILALCGLSEHPFVTCTLRVFQCHRLMPLFDCFQSTFKDNMRFFAGFYFLYRVAILGVYTFSLGPLAFYGISELFLVIFLGATAIAQPHKLRKHNILDGLLILNLVVINGLTMFAAFEESKCNENEPANGKSALIFALVGYIQIILVYAPMLCVVCYWAYKRLKQKRPRTDNDGEEENDENRELLFDSDRSGNYGATY